MASPSAIRPWCQRRCQLSVIRAKSMRAGRKWRGQKHADEDHLRRHQAGRRHDPVGRPELHIANPAQARRMGIGMVFQHFSLFETLTVGENIALALDVRTPDSAYWQRVSREVSEKYGFRSTRIVWCTACPWASGSASRSCAACCRSPSCLIMDEPTSVLTPQAVLSACSRPFGAWRPKAAVFSISATSSTKSARLCDTATVLRGGRVSGTAIPGQRNRTRAWRA